MKNDTASIIANVVLQISEIYNIQPEYVIGKGKRHKAGEARYIVYYYLHYEVGLSSSVIGRYFKCSRYNVLRGIRILKGWMEYHAETKERYQSIVEKLKGEGGPSSHFLTNFHYISAV